MNCSDKTDYLRQQLQEAFDIESQTIKYFVPVGESLVQEVCQGAFKAFYGISNDKMQTVLTKFKQGGYYNFQEGFPHVDMGTINQIQYLENSDDDTLF